MINPQKRSSLRHTSFSNPPPPLHNHENNLFTSIKFININKSLMFCIGPSVHSNTLLKVLYSDFCFVRTRNSCNAHHMCGSLLFTFCSLLASGCKSEGKKNLGQYPLNELKVPCKNSSSLEIKIKQPKSRHETFMLVAALRLYKLFERDDSHAHPTALQFVSITYSQNRRSILTNYGIEDITWSHGETTFIFVLKNIS